MASKYKNTVLAVAALGVGALAIFTVALRGPSTASANAASCAVYVAFYEQFAEEPATFFRPNSHRFSKRVSPDAPPRLAPLKFMRDTGEVEIIRPYTGAAPLEKKIRKTYAADVSNYFEPLWSGSTANVKPCFKGTSGRPGFHKGRYKPLYYRERLLGRDKLGIVTVWRMSPIGFSEDGKRALLYAEYYCGGNCGGGLYYLFENQGGRWVNIGDNRVWVS